MDYSTFTQYNKRSRDLNGRNNVVYLNDIRQLFKKNRDDLGVMRLILNIDEGDEKLLPNKAYFCNIDNISGYLWDSANMLLSSLIERVIACELWVSNPGALDNDKVLSGVELLPHYTPITLSYDGDYRLMIIKVDDITVAACCFSELQSSDAAREIQMKALKNLRKYGFITANIERRLLEEISGFLVEEVIKPTNGIEIGAL